MKSNRRREHQDRAWQTIIRDAIPVMENLSPDSDLPYAVKSITALPKPMFVCTEDTWQALEEPQTVVMTVVALALCEKYEGFASSNTPRQTIKLVAIHPEGPVILLDQLVEGGIISSEEKPQPWIKIVNED